MSTLDAIRAAVQAANESGHTLRITGGETKSFFYRYSSSSRSTTDLNTTPHTGIIDYHPSELVVRVKAGTTIRELKSLLASENQLLGFDPPEHGAAATIGGVIAAGLSGSARPWRGAARDAVLGVGLVMHDGNYLEFGGQVMKNVAGYDVSRLACGSHGTLGVIADVSLKVLPAPVAETTLAAQLTARAAQKKAVDLVGTSLPVTGCCYFDGQLMIRLAGSPPAVQSASHRLGGDEVGGDFWQHLDAQRLPLFNSAREIWRLSCPPDEPLHGFNFEVMDWGFGQRWLLDPGCNPREGYTGRGHWTCYRGGNAPVFEPLSPAILKLHERVKSVFDPAGIFNPGHLVPGAGS